jgi:hypothetical protein
LAYFETKLKPKLIVKKKPKLGLGTKFGKKKNQNQIRIVLELEALSRT